MDAELEAILEIIRAIPKPTTHPVELTDEYLRLVACVESSPKDQTGTDKTWVPDSIEAWKEHYRNAVRVR